MDIYDCIASISEGCVDRVEVPLLGYEVYNSCFLKKKYRLGGLGNNDKS